MGLGLAAGRQRGAGTAHAAWACSWSWEQPSAPLLLSQPQESSPEPASRPLAEQEPLRGKPR